MIQFQKKTVKTTIIFLFSIFIFNNNGFAQILTQTVKGKVIDIDSETPIPGVNIVLLDSDPVVGTTTDIDGMYKFNSIPIGRRSFKISYLGYDNVYLNEITIESGREVMLNISMKENAVALDEVVLKANDRSKAINQMTAVSANQITIESTSRIAAGINDPGRTVQSLAGISTASDQTNELVIRGNSPRGMLWRMQGVEIPNPNHFSSEGGSGGGVSALSTQVLANSDFIISAFPAEYGNAISGIYDLRLRKGNSEKREYAFQLGILGLQLAAEGPFKKKSRASYLFNYRYSTFSLINKTLGTTIGGYVPSWQDLSFNLYVPAKKIGNFSLWGITGNSLYENYAIPTSSKSSTRQELSKNSLYVVGLTHNYYFHNWKTYIRTTFSSSFTNNHFVRDLLDNENISHPTLDLSYLYNTLSINSYINHKFNAKNLVRIGIILSIKGYNINMFDLYSAVEKTEEKGSTKNHQIYLQWKHRINNEIEIISGVHSTYLLLNNKFTIEPRLGLKWKVNEKNMFSFGLGMHSKSEPISVYLWEERLTNGNLINPNKNLDFTKALHAVIGYNWKFFQDFRLKTEFYYQHIYNVPIDSNDNTGTRTSLNFRTRIDNAKLTNEGTGRNYGIEFSLEKFFSFNWYALVTSSLFESKYTMPNFEERNTLFNSNFINNIVAGKEFKFGKQNQHLVGLNLRSTWRGGYRNIPIDLLKSIETGQPKYTHENSYKKRLPDYFRTDFGINYSFNKSNKVWKISVDIQNITNSKNIRSQFFDVQTSLLKNEYFQGITPNINFLLEF